MPGRKFLEDLQMLCEQGDDRLDDPALAHDMAEANVGKVVFKGIFTQDEKFGRGVVPCSASLSNLDFGINPPKVLV